MSDLLVLPLQIAGGIVGGVIGCLIAGKFHEMLQRRKQFGRFPYSRWL